MFIFIKYFDYILFITFSRVVYFVAETLKERHINVPGVGYIWHVNKCTSKLWVGKNDKGN